MHFQISYQLSSQHPLEGDSEAWRDDDWGSTLSSATYLVCDFGHVTTSQNLTFKIGVLVFTPGVVVRGICKALSVWYS